MLKQRLLSIALLAGMPMVAQAVGPHDGVWKINDAKSNWSDGNFPKNMSLTLTIKFTDL